MYSFKTRRYSIISLAVLNLFGDCCSQAERIREHKLKQDRRRREREIREKKRRV